MTQQDIQALQLLAAIEEEERRKNEAQSFLDFLGRVVGAAGRGALGAGRFTNENVIAPTGERLGRIIEPAIPNLDPNQPGLDPQQRATIQAFRGAIQGLDQTSAAGGSAVAQQFAPLLGAERGIGGLTQLQYDPLAVPGAGVSAAGPIQPNSFDAFLADLEQRRQAQSLLDALTLRADREAFRESDIPPVAKFAFEAAGDVTNLIPGAALAHGLGLAGRAVPRAAGEGVQSIVQTGARQVPNALERGTLQAERSAARQAVTAPRTGGFRGAVDEQAQVVEQAAAREPFEGVSDDDLNNLLRTNQEQGIPITDPQNRAIVDELVRRNTRTETTINGERVVGTEVPPAGPEDVTPAEAAIPAQDLRSAQQAISRQLTQADVGDVPASIVQTAAEQKAREIQRVRFQTGEAVKKLSAQLREANPLTPAQIEAIRKPVRKQRVAALARELEQGQGSEAFIRGTSRLAGELPNPSFQAPVMTADEVFLMTEHVRTMPTLRPHTRRNTWQALNKLLLGETPQRSELILLERAFGRDLVQAFLSRPRGAIRAASIISDVLNVPKTLRSAFDLSAPLRQGLLLGPRNPREFTAAFRDMFKSVFKQDAFEINREIFADPDIQVLSERGLFLHNVEGAGPAALTGREEAFVSRLASRIPGVGLSERTYGTFLNKLRSDVAKKTINKWRQEGVLPSVPLNRADLTAEQQARLDSLNRFINVFTGRGELGRFENIADTMNVAFWSPRLVVSRFQAPLLLRDPLIRRQAAENLVATFALGTTVLALVESVMPGKQVETDPRSTDFGKVRLGPTRLDFWGGFQQIARYMAQIATNQTKDTETGEVFTQFGTSRFDRIARFGRSKLSPGVATLLVNELFGESFLRDELGEEPVRGALPEGPIPIQQGLEAATLESTREQEAIQQLAPLFGIDVVNAMEEQGIVRGTALAFPSLFGVGTQTFNGEPETALGSERQPRNGLQLFEPAAR